MLRNSCRLRFSISSVIGLVGFCSLVAVTEAAQSDYRLGPEDKIRLLVYEWRPSRGEAYSWLPLNSEFTVGPDGMLSLPIAGSIQAQALTPTQLSSVISEQLQKKMGLVERPSTSVEIVKYRPIYIMGDVTNPGEFPFRPGLTALKSIPLAGGFYRASTTTAAALEREATVARGELRVLQAEEVTQTARYARLKAEAQDQSALTPMDPNTQIKRGPSLLEARNEEQSILDSRDRAVRSKIDGLNQAKTLLSKEITTLDSKEATINKQLNLATVERDNVKALADKGLVISNRAFSTEQTVAQLESVKLDIGVARIRAEQDRAKLDRDILELRNQRRAEILLELRQTESILHQIAEKKMTNNSLAENAELLLTTESPARSYDEPLPIITIVRSIDGVQTQISADNTTAIEPGDVINVRRQRTGTGSAKLGSVGAGSRSN